jgi:hypothetical protein
MQDAHYSPPDVQLAVPQTNQRRFRFCRKPQEKYNKSYKKIPQAHIKLHPKRRAAKKNISNPKVLASPHSFMDSNNWQP